MAKYMGSDREYWRLRGLEAAYDPPTLRTLDAIGGRGILPGWRCVEVAGGTGSIALAIQARVGAVTVLDIDTRHIQHLTSPSFVVIEGDIQSADLPKDRDLIHSRFLLDLVGDPLAVLRKMMDSLRGGGWLVVEEFDDITMVAEFGAAARTLLHMKVLQAKQQLWNNSGHDNFIGRKLPDWLIDIGLINVESECACKVRRSGTQETRGWRQFLLSQEEDLKQVGLSAQDFNDYMNVLEESGVAYFSPLVVRSWGQVPSA
jgi:SAM-dependent methyltransferase